MSKQLKRKKLYVKARNIIRNNVDKTNVIYKVTKSNAYTIVSSYHAFQKLAAKRRRQMLFIMKKKNEIIAKAQ